MRIFLYEFVTANGLLDHAVGEPPSTSLVREGAAMLAALAEDFAAIDGVEVVMLQAGAAEDRFGGFDRLAAGSDWTLVIAPEFDGILLDRCRRVESVGGRLLGPSPEVVELCSDKHATALHLAMAGVPAPTGCLLDRGVSLPDDFLFPAVLKPRFGAGSQHVRLVRSLAGLQQAIEKIGGAARLERCFAGMAASVAVLCGPAVGVSAAANQGPQLAIPLVPCKQVLSEDGCFAYRGGELPLPETLARRATALACRAVASLPQPLGYIGVDLVLGDDPSGVGDVVIEINPRLTTSYVGLRAAAESGVNLAAAILAVACGDSPRLCFRTGRVRFAADGRVWD